MIGGRRAALAAALLALAGAAPGGAADAAPVTWAPAISLHGVVDLAGPRSDGMLVAAADGRLRLIDRLGRASPPLGGDAGYRTATGTEPYIALSPGLDLPDAGCGFGADTVAALEPAGRIGVVEVDPAGSSHRLADVAGVDGLGAIAFDTAGGFGHRLIVTGPTTGSPGRTTVAAIDCRGGVRVVTTQAPRLEGGVAVAPPGFGPYGGELVAGDELGGEVVAVAPDGRSATVVASGLPAGGDVGVESAGFAGSLDQGVGALVADRGTPGSPHPGSDVVLSLGAAALRAAGVAPGDLLVASEGGAATVAVRCATACRATAIAADNGVSHVEGHLLAAPLAATGPPTLGPTATPGPAAAPGPSAAARVALPLGLGALLAAGAVAVVVALRRRRRRG